MYTHVTLGTNDLAKGRDFYDAVLATLGITRFREIENAACFWRSESGQMFILCRPRDGNPATVGNGVTIGFAAPTRAAVHAFHEAGLKAGGTDEGAPGPREFAPNAYAAYLRDPDGNKITALCMAAE